jgi:hypothetical protein
MLGSSTTRPAPNDALATRANLMPQHEQRSRAKSNARTA